MNSYFLFSWDNLFYIIKFEIKFYFQTLVIAILHLYEFIKWDSTE